VTDSARAIENLLYTYAERIDAGDLDGVAELFAHGRICGLEDTPETTVEGRDAVRAMYEASTRVYPETGTPMTKHVVTNARIEVDDGAGTASARSYYTVLQATDGLALQPIITGRYHDTFHRLDGAWWFETRIMLVDQLGDLSHHLKFELPS
jgi:3-phenylpropionate/cinnamic acid dioxygenase small subunit